MESVWGAMAVALSFRCTAPVPDREQHFVREGNLVLSRELPGGYFLWSPVFIREG